MRDEVFDVEFEYKGEPYKVRVKTDLPLGPEPLGADYDIYIGRKHIYTLNHCKNEDEVHCWEISKRPGDERDPDFAQAIGNAIDKYYS